MPTNSQFVDKFLNYFINKFFVFKTNAELHESNTIDDIDILKNNINIDKITKSDNNMIKLCKIIIQTFKCYNITTDPLIEQIPLSEKDADNIFLHFKNYKMNSDYKQKHTETDEYNVPSEQNNSKKMTMTSKKTSTSSKELDKNENVKVNTDTLKNSRDEIILNNNLNMKDVFYVFSLDHISTQDLIRKFGNYITTSDNEIRYEYRLKFKYNSEKDYIFSIYDYIYNEDNDDVDIYWHLASNTNNPYVHESFLKVLYQI